MKHLLLITLLLTLPAWALAAEPSQAEKERRQRVEHLLVLIDADAMIDNIYGQMDQVMLGLAEQLEIQPAERAVFDRYNTRMVGLLREEMNWERLKTPMIDLYLKHYSDAEIRDITAFYNTPSGQSLLKKMPLIMQDSMQISQEMMQTVFPKLQQLMEEMETEIQASRQPQD